MPAVTTPAPGPGPDSGTDSGPEAPPDFLALLLEGAPRSAYDELLEAARAPGGAGAARVADQVAVQHARALRLREQMEQQRRREAEMAALYETAGDLTAIRDLDQILAAIVRRARQLLRADMTYLSLNDEAEGASYMKVTDGALTPEFRTLRLPLGTGLLGLVAQTGEPYFTEDYQSDQRFVHREYIDDAVAGEHIRAILGVPLMVDGEVIGTLIAVHRSVRRFPPAEVALLTSFAAHAAVALQNARLFEQTTRAVADLDAANRQLRDRTEATEQAAQAHDLLTDVVLHGGGVREVHAALAEVLGGRVQVVDPVGAVVAGSDEPLPLGLDAALEAARGSGRAEPVAGDPLTLVTLAAAGDEHLATLVVHSDEQLTLAGRRTLERGALVTALVLLFARVEAEADERVRGELLADVLRVASIDPDRLRERAARQGVRLDGPLVVAVARPPGSVPLPRAGRLAADHCRERQGLGGDHDGHAVAVVPAATTSTATATTTGPREVGAALASRVGPGCTVGVATCEGPAGIPSAYAEAVRVVGALRALGREGEVSDPAGLGVARLLLASHDPVLVDEFLTVTIRPLEEYDARRGTALVETLAAWFDVGGSVAATARELFVHPNTVAQRLDRIAAVLGDDWRAPGRALDLQLALRVRSLQTSDRT